MELLDNPQGNYRFLTGIAPYSSGVVAMPGYEIVHVTLHQPIPYRQGFNLINQHLTEQSRSRYALCAIELRSPTPFTFAGFNEFNQGYQDILADWDLMVDGRNPIARTNIAPEVYPPGEPSLYAFSFTVPSNDPDSPLSFVISGAGDLAGDLSPEAIVRAGETTTEAMQEKAAHVMNIMRQRLAGLGAAWSDVTAVDIYTVHALQPFLAGTILDVMGSATTHGIRWFFSHPPIAGLEFEMDMRGIQREIRL